MKKVFTFLSFLLLVAFVLPNVSYGHASNDFRSRCSWWKKRYKSKTRITELGIIPLCIQNRSGCSTVSASCVKNCGIAEARAGASINYVRAISFPSGGLICGAGEGLSQLSKLIIDNREADFGSYEDNISAVSEFYYEQEIDFENRQYMLSNSNCSAVLKISKKSLILILC